MGCSQVGFMFQGRLRVVMRWVKGCFTGGGGLLQGKLQGYIVQEHGDALGSCLTVFACQPPTRFALTASATNEMNHGRPL